MACLSFSESVCENKLKIGTEQGPSSRSISNRFLGFRLVVKPVLTSPIYSLDLEPYVGHAVDLGSLQSLIGSTLTLGVKLSRYPSIATL
jgi:hypothetical protein